MGAGSPPCGVLTTEGAALGVVIWTADRTFPGMVWKAIREEGRGPVQVGC